MRKWNRYTRNDNGSANANRRSHLLICKSHLIDFRTSLREVLTVINLSHNSVRDL